VPQFTVWHNDRFLPQKVVGLGERKLSTNTKIFAPQNHI